MNIIHENKIKIIAEPFLVHVGALKATWTKIDARWHSKPHSIQNNQKTVEFELVETQVEFTTLQSFGQRIFMNLKLQTP